METIVVKSKAKATAKPLDVRFPDKAVDALNKKVHELIKTAAKRAKANKRKTIIAEDF